MKYESAWVKRREDRAGKPFVGYLKYRENKKWKQVSKTLKTYVDPKTGEERPVKGARQAERALQQWRLEMEATSSVVSDKTYVSVYANRYLDALALKVDLHTVEQKRAAVKNYFGEFERVPLGKLTTSAVQDWVLRLQSDGLQANTVSRVFGVMRQACRHAVKVGDIPTNPCEGVILPSPPKPTPNAMEPADIVSLLDRLNAMGPTALATAAYTALLCGCRVGEICALTWADYDEDERNISRSTHPACRPRQRMRRDPARGHRYEKCRGNAPGSWNLRLRLGNANIPHARRHQTALFNLRPSAWMHSRAI